MVCQSEIKLGYCRQEKRLIVLKLVGSAACPLMLSNLDEGHYRNTLYWRSMTWQDGSAQCPNPVDSISWRYDLSPINYTAPITLQAKKCTMFGPFQVLDYESQEYSKRGSYRSVIRMLSALGAGDGGPLLRGALIDFLVQTTLSRGEGLILLKLTNTASHLNRGGSYLDANFSKSLKINH